MKQHITSEQLKEVSTEKRIKLLNCSEALYVFMAEANPWELITIGKMIEILKNKNAFNFIFIDEKGWNVDIFHYIIQDVELCDALWEAVKEVL